ncbi:hypothetical protein [Paenibacillus sp. KN14-4R]|uniref:hypothetical protein n=1 Tax=Paenibacillus sp. KN14-4R TaxID=3445773 RepID=UPI003FA01C49
MRRVLKYVFPALLICLGYLVYVQWFSPSAPTLYLPPSETKLADKLTELPYVSLDGKKGKLQMKDAKATVFLVDSYLKGSPTMYETLQAAHEQFAKRGMRLVYLWRGSGTQDRSEEVMKMIKLNDGTIHVASNRKMNEQYHKLGIEIVMSPLVFAYNEEGKLIFQKDGIYKGDLFQTMLSIPVGVSKP